MEAIHCNQPSKDIITRYLSDPLTMANRGDRGDRVERGDRVRERERERAMERDETRARRETARDPPRERRVPLNEYFVDGEGIHREVMQTEICKYLGAEATSRPTEYNVRPPGLRL